MPGSRLTSPEPASSCGPHHDHQGHSAHSPIRTGTTSNPAMYAGEWLAAIPIQFHVEGGPELRAAVAAVAERLTAALRSPQTAGVRRG